MILGVSRLACLIFPLWTVSGSPRFSVVDDLEICGRRFVRARPADCKEDKLEGELSTVSGSGSDATGREVQKHSRQL